MPRHLEVEDEPVPSLVSALMAAMEVLEEEGLHLERQAVAVAIAPSALQIEEP